MNPSYDSIAGRNAIYTLYLNDQGTLKKALELDAKLEHQYTTSNELARHGAGLYYDTSRHVFSKIGFTFISEEESYRDHLIFRVGKLVEGFFPGDPITQKNAKGYLIEKLCKNTSPKSEAEFLTKATLIECNQANGRLSKFSRKINKDLFKSNADKKTQNDYKNSPQATLDIINKKLNEATQRKLECIAGAEEELNELNFEIETLPQAIEGQLKRKLSMQGQETLKNCLMTIKELLIWKKGERSLNSIDFSVLASHQYRNPINDQELIKKIDTLAEILIRSNGLVAINETIRSLNEEKQAINSKINTLQNLEEREAEAEIEAVEEEEIVVVEIEAEEEEEIVVEIEAEEEIVVEEAAAEKIEETLGSSLTAFFNRILGLFGR